MPVHRLLDLVGGLSLTEISYQVAISEELEIPLEEIGRMPIEELHDWVLLLDIEAERAAQLEENERRRSGEVKWQEP